MAYVYLLDMYKLIDQRIEDARAAALDDAGDTAGEKFQEGRIRALVEFKDYLAAHFNSKLPRRIRLSLEDQ